MKETRSTLMPRPLIAAGVFLLVTLSASGCDEECNIFVGPCEPTCPASFGEGDPCLWEYQQCVFSTGACRALEDKRTMCTCTNQPGGFRWDCQIKFCSCTCPCGVLATASCDALDCSDAEDECPENAMPFCEQHCVDGGLFDGGVDAGDAGPDGALPDGAGHDGKGDSVIDAAPPDGGDAGGDAVADLFGEGTGDGPMDAAAH